VRSRSPQTLLRLLYGLLLTAALGCAKAESPQGGEAGGPSQNTCSGADCTCADAGVGYRECASQCVPLATDDQNCGGCGNVCGDRQSCVKGSCTCDGGEKLCGGQCVQASSDSKNCGACGKTCAATDYCQAGVCVLNTTGCRPACEGGQTCNDGECECATGQSFCNGRCVNSQLDPLNCGGCGQTCAAGQSCSAGACTCGNGKAACGTRCVDTGSDPDNCGSCGHACGAAQSCKAGSCESVWSDGCGDTPARGLALRELAVYQTIKVPVMSAGAAVPTSARVADIVQGRAAVFRVFVDAADGFKPRDFSARLTIKNGSSLDRFALKQRINGGSQDDTASTTFQLKVPANKLGADTSYSIELVECAAGSGDASRTRFPASGVSPLGARKLGALKVVVIPVKANGRAPDTSDSALAPYRDYLQAIYPIERVELSVGKQISTSYPINWTTLVEQVRAQRKADAPPAEVYYYGLVQPTATLKDYCKGGCTAGIGYVTPVTQPATRAAVGLAFGDEISASTMAHEIGHNHGRNHAPCSPSNSISGVDEDYPYAGAVLGVWGYDARKDVFLAPSTTMDVMGYCDPKWMSDYTFKGLLERISTVNGGGGIAPQGSEPLARYRVLIVDEAGPRWSVPFDEPIEAYGVPETAQVLDVDGNPIASVIVYRTLISEGEGSSILVPEPEPGWNAIQVNGAAPLAFSAPVTVPPPE